MSVGIVFSLTNGGPAITTLVDHGSAANGIASSATEIFIRHDGSNPITNVGLYLRQVSGTYSGSFTAPADVAEILAWGDGVTAAAFGGFQCNFDAVGTYPADTWPTYSVPTSTNGSVFKTGVGDTEGNAVILPVATGASVAGSIQAGSSPNVRFKTRVAVPADEDTVGIRQFEWVIRYNFSS
jgi:hypothetical protein